VSLTNFNGLRAEIDLIVYAMFILCAVEVIIVYSIACSANESTSTFFLCHTVH
jgi:hypothetical protein